jgi:hypothetical protein
MKKIKFVTIILILFTAFVSFTSPKVYGQSDGSSELIIYRPEQSAMSGAAGIEIKVFINEQEVGVILNGTVLNYTVFSQGALKIKFLAVGMGTTVGSPSVINLEAKHGETTAIEVSYKFPKGAESKILNAKEHEKVKKLKWVDTMKGKENIEKPLIEKK